MSFTYNLNIPAANNNPSADQPNMKTNTNSINSILNVDHFPFAAGNAGRHKQVTLTNEAAPGFTGGNGTLYANLASGQSWPFWQNALGSFQLAGQNSVSANGYTTLPGGVILQWGTKTINFSGSSTSVSFPLTFPNAAFSVTFACVNNQGNSPSANNIYVRSGTLTTSGFTASNSSSGGTTAIFWMAIGN
jgi:hypothetical protein